MNELKSTLCSVSEIAQLLMLDERRIQQLTKEGVIPKLGHGQYELTAAVQGYIDYLKERALVSTGGGSIDYHAEKARLTKLQADTAEVELAQLQGEVVNITEVEKALAAVFTEIRINVMNVVPRAALWFEGESKGVLKKKLHQELTQVLERVAKGVEQIEQV